MRYKTVPNWKPSLYGVYLQHRENWVGGSEWQSYRIIATHLIIFYKSLGIVDTEVKNINDDDNNNNNNINNNNSHTKGLTANANQSHTKNTMR